MGKGKNKGKGKKQEDQGAGAGGGGGRPPTQPEQKQDEKPPKKHDATRPVPGKYEINIFLCEWKNMAALKTIGEESPSSDCQCLVPHC
ncbi:unnamed protein product [Hermetia illucens]|uniref:Uncharacterized protein n=1 Tax=Hermetia illucens TaxID=343691 RepID=A0A7R8UII6_HERIL|nr:unnamed protein product [Hermetia illucens]